MTPRHFVGGFRATKKKIAAKNPDGIPPTTAAATASRAHSPLGPGERDHQMLVRSQTMPRQARRNATQRRMLIQVACARSGGVGMVTGSPELPVWGIRG